MNIALFGATGMIGSRILAEAVGRGHDVTAIVRNPAGIAATPRIHPVAGDARTAASVAATATGADVAVSAYSPGTGDQADLSRHAHALLEGLPLAGVTRVVIVGGAASLEIAPGVRLFDSPDFPELYRARAHAQIAMFDVLRGARDAATTWTFVSPPAEIAPGERTGSFRLGSNELLIGSDGRSRISAEDYAIAILDEVEVPQHPNTRFTVAY